MATQWYCRACGQDLGPLSFVELARLVRDGSISDRDLVRADWEVDWHCAADVVGLFHRARRLGPNACETGAGIEQHSLQDLRSDVTAASRTSGSSTADSELMAELPDATAEDLESLLGTADPLADRPGWMRRLVEVASRRRRPIGSRPPVGGHDNSVSTPSRLPSAIHAALTSINVRAARSAPGRFAKWRGRLDGYSMLRTAFRWGMSILIGNAVGFAILSWSELESQRLPGRQPADLRPFPFWGSCDSLEFALLLVNCMLVAGVAGYFVARGLELMTDE